MAARAKSLKFKGEFFERVDEHGTVVVSGFRESLPGIPTQDLDEDVIRELTDEQYRDAVQSGLYAEPGSKPQAPQLTDAQKAALKKGYTIGTDDPPRVTDAPSDVPSTTPVDPDAGKSRKKAATPRKRDRKAERARAGAKKAAAASDAPAREPVDEAPNGGNADGAGAES